MIAVAFSTCFSAAAQDAEYVDTLSNGNVEITSYGEKHAIIAVGSYLGSLSDIYGLDLYYFYYLSAAQRMYNVLVDKYSFSDDNIHVLINLLPGLEEPENFNSNIIDDDNNKANLQAAFSSVGSMSSDGLLFFTWIGHGNIDKFSLPADSISTKPIEPEPLFGNYLTASELAGYASGIAGKIIYVLQPCGSGSFCDDLSGEDRIICTSTMPGEIWGDGWVEAFIEALAGEGDTNGTRSGMKIGNGNKDGTVSIHEAYYFAAQYLYEITSQRKNHSLLEDNPANGNSGSFYLSSEYDPTREDKDGYYAYKTSLNGVYEDNPDSDPVVSKSLSKSKLQSFISQLKSKPLVKSLNPDKSIVTQISSQKLQLNINPVNLINQIQPVSSVAIPISNINIAVNPVIINNPTQNPTIQINPIQVIPEETNTENEDEEDINESQQTIRSIQTLIKNLVNQN